MSPRGVRKIRAVLAGLQWGGALTAALALAGLMTLGSPGTDARAASAGDNYNQMTGFGTTASAVTVPWTAGLLNAQNQPISTAGSELSPNSDRAACAANPSCTSATNPLGFMAQDFKGLSVTVSQTQDITHQGITVSWTGGIKTPNAFATQGNFLQIMECYGDSSTGPSPENCEYGSNNMLPGGQINSSSIGSRGWDLCKAGSQPNPVSPPSSFDGTPSDMGCDPSEPTSETPAHCDPQAAQQQAGCQQGYFYVPFVPVNDPANPLYAENLTQDFSQFNSNELQFANTDANGNGTVEFDALTSVEAPWLGCGALESNNQPRGCWLVIVPRGQYDANGSKATLGGGGDPQAESIEGSPLSASDWAQRIQVHLSYAPLGTACPLTSPSRFIEGSQVITRAMSSWQFALNQAANCSRLFTFTSTAETQTTTDLTTVGTQTGMAFTTIPIGSEAARENLPPPTLPKILYAPVAVTALDFGFNVNLTNVGHLTTPVDLTPRLVAKAVTQVYREDLPDFDAGNSSNFPGPSWSVKNPETILYDPAFKKVNSWVGTGAGVPRLSYPQAPLLVGDRSADNQRVWQWMQSDATTNSWLDGTADPTDPVTADPDYVKANLGKSPASDSFPLDYTGTTTCGAINGTGPTSICITNQGKTDKTSTKLTSEFLLPVSDNFDDSAAATLSAINKAMPADSWSALALGADGTNGWWQSVGYEVTGSLFMWGLSDTPDIASYGLTSANLCDSAGGNCVGPTIASVTKTLDSAAKDTQGLLQVNPAKIPAGGYPLVDVVYAAVPTNQSAAALNDYADLIQYAVTNGQKAGTAPGDLPPGYLPLPANLANQAQSVVKQIRAAANPSHSPGGPGSPTHTGPGTTPGTTPGSGRSASPGASASISPSAPGPSISPPSPELASSTTPRDNVGKIRYALTAVLIIGAASALSGGALRARGLPPWLNWLNRLNWLTRTRK